MEIKRFFAPQSALSNNLITITGDEFYHLSKVLRHKIGYKIIVSLEDGKDYYCTITKMEKDSCEAIVDDVEDNPCISDVKITLFQAIPKGSKIDLIIQKTTELGVDEIVPFYSKYTNEKKFNIERNKKIAVEASKQSGRAKITKIRDVISFEDMLDMLLKFDLVIMPYEHSTEGRIGDIKKLKTAKNIAYIIGSEGGFDALEVQKAQEKGAKIVTLGKTILRVETAAIVALAIIKYELGY